MIRTYIIINLTFESHSFFFVSHLVEIIG